MLKIYKKCLLKYALYCKFSKILRTSLKNSLKSEFLNENLEILL